MNTVNDAYIEHANAMARYIMCTHAGVEDFLDHMNEGKEPSEHVLYQAARIAGWPEYLRERVGNPKSDIDHGVRSALEVIMSCPPLEVVPAGSWPKEHPMHKEVFRIQT